MDILNKIKRIVGSNRTKGDEIQKLESFINKFDEDVEVDNWLKQNWESTKEDSVEIGDADINKKGLHPFEINKDRFENRFAEGKIAAVAFVLVSLSMGAWLFFKPPSPYKQLVAVTDKEKTLDEVRINSIVLEQGGKMYDLTLEGVKIDDGEVKILGTESDLKMIASNSTLDKEVIQEWSTLKVPKGKDYYVTLSDGTQVWMNACSEMSFPDRFIKGKREIFLKGEAYFIVKSDIENPFLVNTPISTVQVTGTKFNVYSYENEETSLVTLVEGRVGVSVKDKVHHIKPGQQFVQNNEGLVAIKKVDTSQFISWIEGVFEFNDMTLYDMALRLEKWYDVEFYFENSSVSSQRFTGMVKKEHDIEYFINVLEKTTSLRFELQKSKIIVTERS